MIYRTSSLQVPVRACQKGKVHTQRVERSWMEMPDLKGETVLYPSETSVTHI